MSDRTVRTNFVWDGLEEGESALGGLGNAARSATDALAEQGRNLQQLSSRLSSSAAAVAALAGAFGDRDGQGAAGLVARVAQSVAQFTALGSMLGPQGAVVGAIVGAAIPAIQQLTAAHETAAQAAQRQMTALQALRAEAARQTREASVQFAVREGGALGGLGLADFSSEDLTREAGTRREHILEIQRQIAATQSQYQALSDVGEAVLRDTSLAGTAYTAAQERFRAATAQQRAEIARLTEEMGALEAETERRGQASGTGADTPVVAPPPTRHHGRARRDGGVVFGGSNTGTDDARLQATAEESTALLRAQREERDRLAQQAQSQHQLELAHVEELRRAQRREADERERHEQQIAQKRDREHDRRMAQIAQETAQMEAFGNRIGGVFGQAFESAVSGQESFDKALARGAKSALVQFGTQMLVEGVGATLTGIGEAVMNPPGAAAKLAEGAGKIALGVGLGAAGAAIPTPGGGAGGKPQERPRGGASQSGNRSVAPVTINVNAPSAIGGTQVEFGRMAARSLAMAQRRFGRAA